MRTFSFQNPEIMDILNHQVIHMDQGVTYCPEYKVTRAMRHYPSRTAQIIRSVLLKELPASEYGADTVFAPILSGQGERWQNFGEDQNGYLLTLLLGRELFLQEGFRKEEAEALKARVEQNKGLYFPFSEEEKKEWETELPVTEGSRTGLLLDEATAVYVGKTKEKIGTFLKNKGIEIAPDFGPYFTGFDYLAAGLIDEGIAVIQKLLDTWKEENITKMITLSGQSQYVFTVLLPYLGLETEIEFISILDLAEKMEAQNAYLYGGSFFTRYLRKDKLQNQLLSNTCETPILNCPEFLPEVEGDKRKNVVGIWTPPLCAEYDTVGTLEGMEEKIYQDSLGVIKETSFKKLVVCDPYAYYTLLEHGYSKKELIYFTEILK